MRENLALGFVLLVVLAGCAKPLGPAEEAPVSEEQSTTTTTYEPLAPDQARAVLKERGIPYSQHSFLTTAGEGDLEAVRLFIEAGMNVNAQSVNEGLDTALMHAAGGGHLNVVRYLVSQGAQVNLKNGRCAGSLAIEITIENPGCDRQDALMWAAYNGRMKVVEYLIEQRDYIPSIYWFDIGYGPASAMTLAAYGGHLDVVRFLRENVNPNHKQYLRDRFALIWAADQGHLDIVKFLFKEGAGINPVSSLGQRGTGITALMMASYNGHVAVVEFLLDNGADIHVREARWFMTRDGSTWQEFGASALSAAIGQGQDEVMHLLLEHWLYSFGADGHDDHGRTALMYAASWGNMDWIRRLVESGAPVGIQTYVGTTALMFAAAEGHTQAVQFLLDLGEDPNIQNNHGYTALRLAEERGHEAVANLLRNVEKEQLDG